MRNTICPKCHYEFDYNRNMKNRVKGITSFFKLLENRGNENGSRGIESNLITICPACGYNFKISRYKFFGRFDVLSLKKFILLIPIAFIVISFYIILRDFF